MRHDCPKDMLSPHSNPVKRRFQPSTHPSRIFLVLPSPLTPPCISPPRRFQVQLHCQFLVLGETQSAIPLRTEIVGKFCNYCYSWLCPCLLPRASCLGLQNVSHLKKVSHLPAKFSALRDMPFSKNAKNRKNGSKLARFCEKAENSCVGKGEKVSHLPPMSPIAPYIFYPDLPS